MDMKKMTAVGLSLMLVAGGASLSFAAAEEKAKPVAPVEKKSDIKQGDKPAEAEDSKSRGFKKGEKPTETMGTMGKEKTKDGAKP